MDKGEIMGMFCNCQPRIILVEQRCNELLELLEGFGKELQNYVKLDMDDKKKIESSLESLQKQIKELSNGRSIT
jgi:NADP-dependent 3-hydroxy acid dehydrogenase YdfG